MTTVSVVPPPGSCCERSRTAQDSCAFGDSGEAETSSPAGFHIHSGGNTLPVVTDEDSDVTGLLLDGHCGVGRVRMLQNIVDPLLDDAVHVNVLILRDLMVDGINSRTKPH